MSDLAKATLTELKPDGQDAGLPVPVQFNPATMRLQISNSTEGGASRGRQVRQHLGASSTTLTLDLIFDTADEGTTDEPRSVRERTAMVEKYVLPVSQQEGNQAPPRVRFQWGSFYLEGVIDNLNIDIDHFAADGTPLRAKVALTIKEQKIEYELEEAGAGANKKRGQKPGRTASGQPGGGTVPATQSGTALAGESAADFAARSGLDPSAWRGLDIGANSSLSLTAGAEIGFSSDLSASPGIGVTAGFEAGVSASIEASVGLDVDAALDTSTTASFAREVSAGFSLGAAGGVSAAIETVQNANVASAVRQTAQAFNQSLSGSAPQSSAAAIVAIAPQPKLGPPDQPRPPLAQTGLPSPGQQAMATTAPPPPRSDARATSFGFGVPLRSQAGMAAVQRADVSFGGVALKSQVGSGGPPVTNNPIVPHWVALPAIEFIADTAGKIQLKTRPQLSCGCFCDCGCRCRKSKSKRIM